MKSDPFELSELSLAVEHPDSLLLLHVEAGDGAHKLRCIRVDAMIAHLCLVPPIVTVAIDGLLLVRQQRRHGRRARGRHLYRCFCARLLASALAFASCAEVRTIQAKKLASLLVHLTSARTPCAFARQRLRTGRRALCQDAGCLWVGDAQK